ncbi:MAG: DUF3014 domain-containing protein [Pseudomonadales bacterium]
MNRTVLIAALVVAALVIVVLQFLPGGFPGFGSKPEPAAEQQTAPAPPPTPGSQPGSQSDAQVPVSEPAPLTVEPAAAPLPPLEESDPLVVEALAPLGVPQPWLEQGDLLRRLAVVLENAARGDYPRRQLAFLAPAGAFPVIERDDQYLMDPAGFARYDGYVAQLEQMDPDAVAALLVKVEPLLGQALDELGEHADGPSLLESAIDGLLAVPVLEGDVALERPNVLYVYADPALESLKPLQKQLLRTGPDNVRRVQAYLRRLREAVSSARSAS